MAKKVTKTMKEMPLAGQAPVVLALEVQRNLLPMQRRWQRKLLQRLHLYMV